MPITSEHLLEFKSTNIFIETGSHLGDSIQIALDSGYDKVLSIECKKEYYEHCLRRFDKNDKVYLFYGDSSKDLSKMLENIDEPAIIFLDAHYMWNDPNQILEEHPGKGKIPLIDELKQIKKHKLNNHIILIDDIEPLADLTPRGKAPPTGSQETMVNSLIKFCLTINPDYKFDVVDFPGLGKHLKCYI